MENEEEFREFIETLNNEHLMQHTAIYASNRLMEKWAICINEVITRVTNER